MFTTVIQLFNEQHKISKKLWKKGELLTLNERWYIDTMIKYNKNENKENKKSSRFQKKTKI